MIKPVSDSNSSSSLSLQWW